MKHKKLFLDFAKLLQTRIRSWDLSKMHAHDKEDGSPVTRYDEELNLVINHFLRKNFPEHNIVGEEEQDLKESEYTWYVDPIDGTKEFIKQNGQWAVQIGLSHRNEVILGFVFHFSEDKLYYAEKSAGSIVYNLKNEKEELLILKADELIPESIGLASFSNKDQAELDYLEKINISKITEMGSFGLKVIQIATAKAHVYANFRNLIGLWDICAPEIILTEAGGKFYFENENPPIYYHPENYQVNRKLLAYHPAMDDKIIRDI
ncbi:MAG: inositol monophosphatase family protein [Bdellovibrionota bacterium]|nr:inositol monophosphatase family protein [Bdellovibrionota bacterium]